MNIAMLEPLDVPPEFLDALAAPLTQAGHAFWACHAPLTMAEKLSRAKAADALLIANSPLGAELLSQAPQLRFISVAFTGTDHLDLSYCRAHGIQVSNCAGYSTPDVAEITLMMMVSLLRSARQAEDRLRAGGTKAGLRAGRLAGRTVGIVGLGAIGLRVAELCRAYGCTVLAHSRRESAAGHALGVRYLPLSEVLRQSDILTLHTPLNEQTRHLIGRDQLALMKKSALLVNCARGPVVDMAALAEALNAGNLAGAAIDVYETEPPIPMNHPLLSASNALLTPHIAFYTAESMKDRAIMAIENLTGWLAGRAPRQVTLKA